MILWKNNIRLAAAIFKKSRARSVMTVLGIAIGVASVATIVSIGLGAKQDIVNQANYFDSDVVTVRPGRIFADNNQAVSSYDLIAPSGSTLLEKDVTAIDGLESTKAVSGFSAVSSQVRYKDVVYDRALIFGVDKDAESLLGQPIAYGQFFTASDNDKPVAVIGQAIAEQVFKENAPIGKTMEIRGKEFLVRGIFEAFPTSYFNPNPDYNYAILLPHEASKSIQNNQANLLHILASHDESISSDVYAKQIEATMLDARSGSVDFSVLTQATITDTTTHVVNLITAVVAVVAGIALLVAGIGIMNIMLVSVTERSEEIGIRKAVGATNQQILSQFMTEALLLSVLGGLFGSIIVLLANYFLRLLTQLQPIVSFQVLGGAMAVSIIVGVIFGVAPALHAARKDPVRALRRD